MKNEYIPIIAVMSFILCFLMTLQIRTIKQSESEATKLKNESELRDELNEWKDMYDTATYKIKELEGKVSDYKNSASKKNDTLALLNDEIENLKVLAGLVEVKGTGVIITLDDTRALDKIAADAGYFDANAYVIQDLDILRVINELRAAGAEAISVNGQRIIATTEIRCVGPVIQINGIRLTAPFKIQAIGAPDLLTSSLKLRGGVVDIIEQEGIDVIIEKSDGVVIPKTDVVVEHRYAKIVEEEE